MDNLIPSMYREYGRYSNWRNFPHIVDGLKPVERRILFSAFQIAKTKFVKSARVDGHVIGNFHPHGSSYGSIVQLVRQGFLEGQGNFGFKYGIEPIGAAASRYTEVKLSELSLNFVFQNIKHTEYSINELGQLEPKFLPVLFPVCLMGKEYTQGIGFGFKTFVPCYEISDLYKRLMWLIKEKTTNEPVIAPITDCKILSKKSALKRLLETGKEKIEVTGIVSVENKNEVMLKSWPPVKKFESILNAISPSLGNVGFTDTSVTETAIKFTIFRDSEEVFKDFIDRLNKAITGYIPFETIVISDSNVQLCPIDEMLVVCFDNFKNITKNMLLHEAQFIKEKIREFEILRTIIPMIKESLENGHDYEKCIQLVLTTKKFKEEEIRSVLNKHRVSTLLNVNLDIKDLEKELQMVETNMKNLEEFVLEYYNIKS